MLAAARDGIVLRGKAEVGDKTMIDAWTPAVDAAAGGRRDGADAAAVLAAAAEAAEAGAEATEPLVARKGRASYLGERSVGPPRPGRPVDARCCCRPRPTRRRGRGGVRWRHPARSAWSSSRTPRRSPTGSSTLAAQMAPTASLVAAGGTDDGRIGTSFDRVSAGIAEADSGDGVVVLCDLGSAILTAETALDFLDDDVRARVRIVDAPLVEGGVAAAVAAESGDDLDDGDRGGGVGARRAGVGRRPLDAGAGRPIAADVTGRGIRLTRGP